MKKGLFLLTFALVGIFSFGQTMHKGSFLGFHILTPNLKEGVTMKDYTKFLMSKVMPAYEKAFPGVKTYLVKCLRGQDSSSIGVILMFNSEADRNKYWNNDGSIIARRKASIAILSALGKEQDKYETTSTEPMKYDDWVVE